MSDAREEIKYRNEIKYICTEQQLILLEKRIQNICRPDLHTGETGMYTVRSVYFDDYNDTCYYENVDGINEREKLRIRIYNGDMSYITLECKKKLNGKNHKDSCRLSAEQCEAILQGTYKVQENDSPLIKKLILQGNTKLMKPKVIVQYERKPFVYGPGNVRITFDRNISGSDRVLEFGEKQINVRPVMSPGYHILEVKYDEFFPDYIRRVMQLEGLQHTAFSKYAICRRMI